MSARMSAIRQQQQRCCACVAQQQQPRQTQRRRVSIGGFQLRRDWDTCRERHASTSFASPFEAARGEADKAAAAATPRRFDEHSFSPTGKWGERGDTAAQRVRGHGDAASAAYLREAFVGGGGVDAAARGSGQATVCRGEWRRLTEGLRSAGHVVGPLSWEVGLRALYDAGLTRTLLAALDEAVTVHGVAPTAASLELALSLTARRRGLHEAYLRLLLLARAGAKADPAAFAGPPARRIRSTMLSYCARRPFDDVPGPLACAWQVVDSVEADGGTVRAGEWAEVAACCRTAAELEEVAVRCGDADVLLAGYVHGCARDEDGGGLGRAVRAYRTRLRTAPAMAPERLVRATRAVLHAYGRTRTPHEGFLELVEEEALPACVAAGVGAAALLELRSRLLPGLANRVEDGAGGGAADAAAAAAAATAGLVSVAEGIHRQLDAHGGGAVHTWSTFSALVRLYRGVGRLEEARRVEKCARERGFKLHSLSRRQEEERSKKFKKK